MSQEVEQPRFAPQPEALAADHGASSQPEASGTFAGRVALLTAGVGAGLVGLHALGVPVPGCPLRATTGFPCPFCGLTTVARHLFTGEIGMVASADPAALALAVILAVTVVAQIVAMARRRRGPALFATPIFALGVLVVLAAHWATTILTGGILAQ